MCTVLRPLFHFQLWFHGRHFESFHHVHPHRSSRRCLYLSQGPAHKQHHRYYAGSVWSVFLSGYRHCHHRSLVLPMSIPRLQVLSWDHPWDHHPLRWHPMSPLDRPGRYLFLYLASVTQLLSFHLHWLLHWFHRLVLEVCSDHSSDPLHSLVWGDVQPEHQSWCHQRVCQIPGCEYQLVDWSIWTHTL